MSKKEYIIGIDLGTANSCVSVMQGGEALVIPNAEGNRTTPSIVAFLGDERKVGGAAKRQAITNQEKTIFLIKRIIGKTYEQVKDMKLPYKVVDNNGRPAVLIGENQYSPEEISAMVLQSMKKTAEDYLGETVTKCVITVPAHFNDAERTATKVAGEIAGMEVVRVINEPTAAALAYFTNKKATTAKIAVFDFGGGTMDMSVLDYADEVYEVLTSDGDVQLGGHDIDQVLIQHIVDSYKASDGMDLSLDVMAMQRIADAAEKAKIELSASGQTDINLPYITVRDGSPKHLVLALTRSKFEQLISSLVQRTIDLSASALKKGNLTVTDIDEVVLVGGSTRIPAVQDAVKKFFNREPNKSMNPDEVVALGAAIQGGVIAGDVTDVLLLDVSSLSYGIETQGGAFTKLVEANTTIPCKRSQVFSTASENQSGVTIKVAQGERALFEHNKSLGEFELGGIQPQPRGVPQIEVTFDIDANGILKVSAKDKTTGKENSIKIEGGSTLTPEEIERMKADAVTNAESDKQRLEEIGKINSADSLVFTLDKDLTEHESKLTPETVTAFKEALDKLRVAVAAKNVGELESLTEALHPFMQELDTVKSAPTNEAAGAAPDAPEAEVEETAYEEV